MNTTYFLNLVAGNVFRSKTSPAIPTAYYLGLSTTAPTLAGGNVTEPAAAGGYQRVQIENLGAPTDGVVKNTAEIGFDESTADWGTLTHYVIYDAQTGGNLLMYGALPNTRRAEVGTVMVIRPGYLELSVTNPA